jgi:hypothetical protein
MSNIKFVEREIVDLRQAKYRIESNGGAIVAELIDFGGDVILIYVADNPQHCPDEQSLYKYGVVQILMDGYVSHCSDDLTLRNATSKAFTLLAIELTDEYPSVSVDYAKPTMI